MPDGDWIVPPKVPRLPPSPRTDQSVWPGQRCPSFDPRQTASALTERWFYRYADFHLDRDFALDVGICRCPERILTEIQPSG